MSSFFCSGICEKRYHPKNRFHNCPNPFPTQSKLTRGIGTSSIAEMVPFFTQPETVKNPRINSDWMGEGLEKLWNMFCGWYLFSQIPDPEKHNKKNGYITWTRLDLLGHTWTQNWTNVDSLGGYSPGAACHYMKVLLYIQIRDMCWSLAVYMYRSNSFQISSSKALNAMYVDRPCCLTNSGGDDVQKHACQAFPWFFLETVRDRLGTVLGTVQRPLGFP